VVRLLEPGVSDDEAALVEDEVRDQFATEGPHLLAELGGLRRELGQRFREPVAECRVFAVERAQELLFVVPGYCEGVSGPHHAHSEPKHPRDVGPAVDEVAEEDRAPSPRVTGVDGATLGIPDHLVAELCEEGLEFGAAAVHIADGVERTEFTTPVGQKRLAHDLGVGDRLDRVEHMDAAESLLAEKPQRPAELVVLAAHDVGAEVAVWSGRVAIDGDTRGDIEHDRHRQHVVRLCKVDERLAGSGLHVGRVDHGQQAGFEPLRRDVAQRVEGRLRGALVVLVIGDECAEGVARQRLVGAELLGRERRLSGPADADQHDERHRGDRERAHAVTRRNSASWVGVPSSGSSGPTPRTSTV
jgi:hypothetical protein